MAASDQLAAKLERLSLDTVEAALLSNHIGQEFDAVVISGSKPAKNGNGNGNGNGRRHTGNGNGPSGVVQIAEPAVTARCPANWNPAPRSGPGAVLRHCHAARSGWSWSADSAASRVPGRVQLI